jgi:hypothetical protein
MLSFIALRALLLCLALRVAFTPEYSFEDRVLSAADTIGKIKHIRGAIAVHRPVLLLLSRCHELVGLM